MRCRCGNTTVKSGATFDVYIGKKKVANDVKKYKRRAVRGKTVTIKDIKTKKAYSYFGKKKVSKKIKKSSMTVNIALKKNPVVKYYANGGTGKTASGYLKYNTYTKLAKNKFTRAGYTFAGWATAKTGAVKYKDGAKLKRKKSISLYAVWKKVGPSGGDDQGDADEDPDGVVFSVGSGAYTQTSMPLTISNPSGYPVLYTTDGSIPSRANVNCVEADGEMTLTNGDTNKALIGLLNAECVQGSLMESGSVPTATVIRAAAELPDGTMGPVKTNTYFLGNTISAILMNSGGVVISIVSDPVNLFDSATGIMAKGDIYEANRDENEAYIEAGESYKVVGNYTQRGRAWERESNFELFDGGDKVAYEDRCGLRLHGASSRSFSQKGFNIYFRGDYGNDTMQYDLFPGVTGPDGNDITTIKSFMVRPGGNETEMIKFKDAMLQEMMGADDMDVSVQASRPAVVFLNGEYYGVMPMQEKYSATWVETHYGVDKDNVLIYDGDPEKLEEGTEEDLEKYWELLAVCGEDLSDEAAWNVFKEMVDVQSMADYYADQIYIGNADWNEIHNYRMWRSREDDGTEYGDAKWRWMLYDTEYSSGTYGRETTSASYDHLQMLLDDENDPIFRAAMQNEEFKGMLAHSLRKAGANMDPNPVFSPTYRKWKDTYWNLLLNSANRFGYPQYDRLTESEGYMEAFFRGRYQKIEQIISDHGLE